MTTTTNLVPYQPRHLLEFIETHKRVPKSNEPFGIYFSRFKSGCYQIHAKYILDNDIIKKSLEKYNIDKLKRIETKSNPRPKVKKIKEKKEKKKLKVIVFLDYIIDKNCLPTEGPWLKYWSNMKSRTKPTCLRLYNKYLKNNEILSTDYENVIMPTHKTITVKMQELIQFENTNKRPPHKFEENGLLWHNMKTEGQHFIAFNKYLKDIKTFNDAYNLVRL